MQLPNGGERIAHLKERLRGWIQAELDLTIAEMCERLAKLGAEIKIPALWHQLNKWGLSLKKTLHASEQEREDVKQARSKWRREQPSRAAASWYSSTKRGQQPA
ncbi:MAG: hypothetical protein FWC18_00900 [Cystobacterineae bacterium]|nr:hypothetical protein [Cystobacterineae bacterium]MCL2258375.1 hypothetical protein [Cystobacterineae bacterium]